MTENEMKALMNHGFTRLNGVWFIWLLDHYIDENPAGTRSISLSTL